MEALVDAAEAFEIDISSALDLRDERSLSDLMEDERVDPALLDRLVAALKRERETEDACIERLRNWWISPRRARRALEKRRAQEDQIRLAASLPDADETQKIARYESHLGREFDRTLKQLLEAEGAPRRLNNGPAHPARGGFARNAAGFGSCAE